MSIFSTLNNGLDGLMKSLDNGKMFIKPIKWLYVLYGVFAFIIPILATYGIFDSDLGRIMDYGNGWEKCMFVLFLLLFIVFMYVSAYIIFKFWMSRKEHIDQVVKVGDNIVATPLVADHIQCFGEAMGVYIGVVAPFAICLFYLFALLSGFDGFYKDGIFIKVLLGCILAILALVILAWFIVFIAHYISEQIRLKANMANDLRDIADIHRSGIIS